MLERIVTQPDNYEPFLLSHGIRFGDLLFISGQAGAGDNGKIVKEGFLAQGRRRLPISGVHWRPAARPFRTSPRSPSS